MTEHTGMPVDQASAWVWVRESFKWGTPLALLVAERWADAPFSARLLVPREAEGLCDTLDDGGRRISTRASDKVAAALLRDLGRSGATTLVVEDELAYRGDPGIGTNTAFIDDRIVHWTALENPEDGPLLMRRVSTGTPLNAFVSRGTRAELGLEHERQLGEADLKAIVAATCAAIVSVYDNEAFLALIHG